MRSPLSPPLSPADAGAREVFQLGLRVLLERGRAAAPGFGALPCFASPCSSAASTASTFSCRDDSPMRPMRHTLPASGPSPPPISMECSASRSLRTAPSSTPAGTWTQLSDGSRRPSCACGAQPSAASPP